MGLKDGRFAQDTLARRGAGFPSIVNIGSIPTLASYLPGVAGIFVPPEIEANELGFAVTVGSLQVWYRVPGAGATSLQDTFNLRLIDTTVNALGTGTVSTTGTSLVGSGTALDTFFAVGDYIQSGANAFKITAIADATHATLEAAPAVDWSAAVFYRVPNLGTLFTINQAKNLRFSNNDLRTNNVGIQLKPGQGLRLDTGAISLTYSPAPVDVTFKMGIEAYSFNG